MSDDYLWDGSGKPDPEVKRLEELLGRYRHATERSGIPPPARRAWARPVIFFAAAAVVVTGVLGVYLVSLRGGRGFEVVRLAGSPHVDASRMADTATLPVGGWVETDASSRAEIRIGAIGEATIEPNTRVRLVRAELTDHRLALARGTLHARIWAPPRLFFVETPSATAVDLGCMYTLSVDDDGGSLLHVTSGWVAFDFGGRESFVPAGAECTTRLPTGPGTPYFDDASSTFRHALEQLDFGASAAESRSVPLDTLLAQARPKDALTLWHLLVRVEAGERGRIHDRLAALVPPPTGVTREGVLGGDREMIDRWWDELGFGVTTWWRMWKAPGPPG